MLLYNVDLFHVEQGLFLSRALASLKIFAAVTFCSKPKLAHLYKIRLNYSSGRFKRSIVKYWALNNWRAIYLSFRQTRNTLEIASLERKGGRT